MNSKRNKGRRTPSKSVQRSIDFLLRKGWIEPDPDDPGNYRTTPEGTEAHDIAAASGVPAMRPATAVGLLHVPYPAPDGMDLFEVEAQLQAVADTADVELVETIMEAGVFPAAPLSMRDAPRRAVDAIRGGTASVVLVLDRGGLAPSPAEVAEFEDRVARAGGSVVFSEPVP